MALSIGELVGYVDLDTTGVKRGAAEARRSIGGLAGDMDGAARKGSRLGPALVTGLKVAGTLFTGLGIAGATMGLKTAAGMESARIAFTTMLGSAGKADKFLRKLSDFAAKTPFEFPELQTAASSLISAGIEADKVIPIMTTLGDVTAGMGTGSEGIQRATVALQQMNAAGRITGEDLNQLRDAGIPVYDLLAAATGKSKAEVVKLAQAGKLGKRELDAMMKALESGKGLERFNGLMAKQSKSLSGQFSTLKDTVNMGLAKAITPLVPLLKDGLAVASGALADAMPKLAAGARQAADSVRSFVQGWKDGTGVGGQFRSVLTATGTAIGAVVGFMVKWQAVLVPLAGGILAIVAAVRIWREVTAAFAAVQAGLNIVLAANPIGLVVLAIVGLVAAFTIAYKRSETFRKIVTKALDGIKAAAKAVGAFFAKTLPAFFSKAWDKVKSLTSGGVDKVVGWVKGLPGKIGRGLMSLGKAVTTPHRLAFNAALDIVRNLGGKVKDWVAGIPGKLLSLGGRFASACKQLLQGFVDGMKNAAGIISGIAGNVWDTVRGLLNGAIGRINAALEFTIDLPGPKNLTINPPNIPQLATGGRVSSGTLAVIGEGREAETVLPDSLLRGLLERVHESGRQSAMASGSQAPLIGTVNQQPGESVDTLAERLYFKLRTRG